MHLGANPLDCWLTSTDDLQLFIWDDGETYFEILHSDQYELMAIEIDEAGGEFNSDYEHAQRCREDIIHFVRELLELPPYRTVNTSFRPVLETSRDVWQRLCRDMTLREQLPPNPEPNTS